MGLLASRSELVLCLITGRLRDNLGLGEAEATSLELSPPLVSILKPKRHNIQPTHGRVKPPTVSRVPNMKPMPSYFSHYNRLF